MRPSEFVTAPEIDMVGLPSGKVVAVVITVNLAQVKRRQNAALPIGKGCVDHYMEAIPKQDER